MSVNPILVARSMVVGLFLAGVAVSCGASSDSESAQESTTTTRATVGETTAETVETSQTMPSQGFVAPLSGVAVDDPTTIERPALVVKIDNHPNARPQLGLDQADLVFDYRAEGVTRFAGVFHSKLPETVGPVRSSRTADFDLVVGFNRPLYASSGGNDNVMGGLSRLPVQAVTNQTRREYFRDNSRPAPHNLLVHPADLYALADPESQAPEPWFEYRADGQSVSSSAVPANSTVTVAFAEGPTVGFSWDEGNGWLRTQNGMAHVTSQGDQLAPENVVILITSYGTSSADSRSPEVRSTGSGELIVLTDGHIITGTWERSTGLDRPSLLDDQGNTIALTPGQTWLLWPEPGQVDLGLDS